MKKIYLFKVLSILVFGIVSTQISNAQTVIITTIVDGPVASDACSGGSGSDPRFIELYVNGTVNFTGYDLDVSINGGSWVSKDISSLGSVSNQFVYLVQNTDTDAFDAAFPGVTKITLSLGTLNGNDAVRVEDSSANVLDVFGNPTEISDSSTFTNWNYQDSYAKRKNGTFPNYGIFNESDFAYPGADSLDGANCATIASTINLGSYLSWEGDDGISPNDWTIAEN